MRRGARCRADAVRRGAVPCGCRASVAVSVGLGRFGSCSSSATVGARAAGPTGLSGVGAAAWVPGWVAGVLVVGVASGSAAAAGLTGTEGVGGAGWVPGGVVVGAAVVGAVVVAVGAAVGAVVGAAVGAGVAVGVAG